MALDASKQTELLMSDSDFERVSELAYLYTGIVFVTQKKDMVYRRLSRRLRELDLQTMEAYFPLIDNETKPEVSLFINAISTNLSEFFREPHHFDYLEQTICAQWKVANSASKKIRVWSAGCSTGEEPYSISMILKENFNNWSCDILATDLDSKLIVKGRHAVYDLESLGPLGLERKKQWFLGDKRNPGVVQVRPELQEMIEFKCLNLLDDWPVQENFDLIFCRNVALYFNESSQKMLFDRFANSLNEEGYLVLGRSERLDGVCQRFKPVGKTIYQKIR
tara:strand:- start:518 stop:1354 length:837 start_codon:yes stop_codon:yes gene_type:complete